MLIYHYLPLVERTFISPFIHSPAPCRLIWSVILLFALFQSNQSFSQISINEVCASNSDTYFDEYGEADDWIELHNTSDTTIDLSNWRIGKNESFEESYPLPPAEDLILEPNAFVILWADNQSTQGPSHLPFQLNNEGDFLTLYNDAGEIIDQPYIPLHHVNNSWGRTSDNEWRNFVTPTPLEENNTASFDGTLTPPTFNLPSGLYPAAIELILSHPNTDALLHYTLDGSSPSTDDNLFDASLLVETNTIIRAAAFAPNFIPSKPAAFHCLPEATNSTPIISITADFYELFGFFGIINQWDSEEEIAASFSYIVNGNAQFEEACGLELHAPAPLDQHGFRLSAKSIYDNPTFDYPFFGENQPATFDRLILRNGGDDAFELGGTFLRDQIIHAAFDEIRPEHSHSASKLVSTYLNGEYWGVHHLRERIDSAHISHHFGQHDVDLLERSAQFFATRNSLSGTWEDYDLLEESVISLDLAQTENFEMISSWMDLSNFTDYQLLQIFISNQDWLSNNMKFWRPIDESEPWKWVLWDTDWGLGMWGETFPVGSPDWNALEFALSDWGGWLEDEVETELLQNLVENDTFLHDFVSRAADLRNSSFETYRWNERIDSALVELSDVTDEHFARWNIDELVWGEEVDTLRSFITERPGIFLEHFTQQFELGEINTLALNTFPEGIGGFEVNSLSLDSSEWAGDYFEFVPVRIKALPPIGYNFVGWSDDMTMETERMIDLSSDSSITVLYELATINNAVQINEIMYASTASEAWIELKNLSPENIDLFGFSLGIDEELMVFTDSITILPNAYFIVCENTSLFDIAYPSFTGQRYEMTSLDLPNDPTTLRLINPLNTLIDSVRYTQSSPWPYQANGSGGSAEFNEAETENSLGINWHCKSTEEGTPGEQNSLPVSINRIMESSISIAPNPFQNQLMVQLPSLYGPFTINIYNIQGQLVHSEISGQHVYQQLILSHLESGCYTLIVSNGNDSFQHLVIKR